MGDILSTKQKIFAYGEQFFHSWVYIALICAIGIAGFLFRLEFAAIYAIATIAAISWALSADMMPSFLAMCIISMTPLKRYGETGYFSNIYYVIFILAAALILRLFFHRPKLKAGKFFIPTLAVAVAVTLGGLPRLTTDTFFSMPSIYYVASLGMGMVIINVILESTLPENKNPTLYFAKIMVGVGVMGIAMIVSAYLQNSSLIESNVAKFTSHFQWGNNLSNMLLLSMPFSFYLSTQKVRFSLFYLIIGVLQYFALLLSLSRGGLIFGTLAFPVCLVLTLVFVKEKRKAYTLAAAIIIGIAVAVFVLYLSPLAVRIWESLKVNSDEARVNLYILAWENFKKFPIFGTGLQYDGGVYYRPQPFCLYWYHSTIFQILGSLGIVGIIAYGIQFVYRLKSILGSRSLFNKFTAISVVAFAAYSMVNVGYFVPLPCMAMLIQMFIVLERNNKFTKKLVKN